MSFQAITWAINQRTGSPSAKAILWSLANYANDQWCCWPSQTLIAHDSEQSVDTVQVRLSELEELALVRLIPLFNGGRKTVNFTILAPSTVFQASLSQLLPLFPRGCSVCQKYAAANVGSDKEATVSASPEIHSGTLPEIARKLRQQQPQSAAIVTGLVRQQEPVIEPESESMESRERVPLISREAIAVSEQIAAIAGLPDPQSWPPGWCGSAMRVDAFLREGYHPDLLRLAARAVMAGRKDPEPPRSIAYFEKAFAKARADHERKLPDVNIIEPERVNVSNRSASANGRFQPNQQGETAGQRAMRKLFPDQAGDVGSGS